MSVYPEEKCPSCGTYPIYEIEPKSYGCKCTYEFEATMSDDSDRLDA